MHTMQESSNPPLPRTKLNDMQTGYACLTGLQFLNQKSVCDLDIDINNDTAF